jgi:hypothetical protein
MIYEQTQDFRDELIGAIRSVESALQNLGNGNASTPMGAVEAHGLKSFEGALEIASAIRDQAEATSELAKAVGELNSTFDEGFQNLSAAIYKGLKEAGSNVASAFALISTGGGN